MLKGVTLGSAFRFFLEGQETESGFGDQNRVFHFQDKHLSLTMAPTPSRMHFYLSPALFETWKIG